MGIVILVVCICCFVFGRFDCSLECCVVVCYVGLLCRFGSLVTGILFGDFVCVWFV